MVPKIQVGQTEKQLFLTKHAFFFFFFFFFFGSYMTFGNMIPESPEPKNVILDTEMLFLCSL